MFNDIVWRNKENDIPCSKNSAMVSEYAKSFALGRRSFFGPGSEWKWNATDTVQPEVEWDSRSTNVEVF